MEVSFSDVRSESDGGGGREPWEWERGLEREDTSAPEEPRKGSHCLVNAGGGPTAVEGDGAGLRRAIGAHAFRSLEAPEGKGGSGPMNFWIGRKWSATGVTLADLSRNLRATRQSSRSQGGGRRWSGSF